MTGLSIVFIAFVAISIGLVTCAPTAWFEEDDFNTNTAVSVNASHKNDSENGTTDISVVDSIIQHDMTQLVTVQNNNNITKDLQNISSSEKHFPENMSSPIQNDTKISEVLNATAGDIKSEAIFETSSPLIRFENVSSSIDEISEDITRLLPGLSDDVLNNASATVESVSEDLASIHILRPHSSTIVFSSHTLEQTTQTNANNSLDEIQDKQDEHPKTDQLETDSVGTNKENQEQEMNPRHSSEESYDEQDKHSENIQPDMDFENIDQEMDSENIDQDMESKNIDQEVDSENIDQEVDSENIDQEVDSENIDQEVIEEDFGVDNLELHEAELPSSMQELLSVTSEDSPDADAMTLSDDVIIDALFTNLDILQDNVEMCEEGLRQRLVQSARSLGPEMYTTEEASDIISVDDVHDTDPHGDISDSKSAHRFDGFENDDEDISDDTDTEDRNILGNLEVVDEPEVSKRGNDLIKENVEDAAMKDRQSFGKDGITSSSSSQLPSSVTFNHTKEGNYSERKRRSIQGDNDSIPNGTESKGNSGPTPSGRLKHRHASQVVVTRLSKRLHYLKSSLEECYILYTQLNSAGNKDTG